MKPKFKDVDKVKGGFKLKSKYTGKLLDKKPMTKKKVIAQAEAIGIAKAKAKAKAKGK